MRFLCQPSLSRHLNSSYGRTCLLLFLLQRLNRLRRLDNPTNKRPYSMRCHRHPPLSRHLQNAGRRQISYGRRYSVNSRSRRRSRRRQATLRDRSKVDNRGGQHHHQLVMGGSFAVLHVFILPGPTGPGPRVSF